MSKMKPLPEFINGFRIVEDLGMFKSPSAKQAYRRCIAVCPKCKNSWEARVGDLSKIQTCLCNRDIQGVSLRLRNIAKDMKKRCYNKNSVRYYRYGGRGIKICDEWRNSTNAFYLWALSAGYNDSLTIDRIRNDGDYSPENCKWSNYSEQMQNSTKAKLNVEIVLTIRGIYPGKSYSELALQFNVSKSTIAHIITRKTWSNI